MKTLSTILFLFLFFQFLLAQPSKFPPINDIGKDKSLVTFVHQLKVAVQKKDKAYVLSVLDEKVMNSFDGEDNPAEFINIWDWEKDTVSLWHYLGRVLELGGAFNIHPEDRYTVVFPYLCNIDLENGDEYFKVGVITGKNVNLREKPELSAKVVGQLTHDVVWFVEGEQVLRKTQGTNTFGDPEWYQIETIDHKKKGWVFWKYVYSPVNYRLFLFKDKKGNWKISTFLAGD